MVKAVDVATYQDKFGATRTIHRDKNGLKVKRETLTPALAMNQPVAAIIGKRIRSLRLAKGWTLEELAVRSGMGSGHPKNRMWEIEIGCRGEGVRMGTLYAIANALGVEATDLMPPVSEILELAKLRDIPMVLLGKGA